MSNLGYHPCTKGSFLKSNEPHYLPSTYPVTISIPNHRIHRDVCIDSFACLTTSHWTHNCQTVELNFLHCWNSLSNLGYYPCTGSFILFKAKNLSTCQATTQSQSRCSQEIACIGTGCIDSFSGMGISSLNPQLPIHWNESIRHCWKFLNVLFLTFNRIWDILVQRFHTKQELFF
jgi:hypothetical protein